MMHGFFDLVFAVLLILIIRILVRIEKGPPPQVCRECGCTETTPCEDGCWWTEDDLCSACDPEVFTIAGAPYDDRRAGGEGGL